MAREDWGGETESDRRPSSVLKYKSDNTEYMRKTRVAIANLRAMQKLKFVCKHTCGQLRAVDGSRLQSLRGPHLPSSRLRF